MTISNETTIDMITKHPRDYPKDKRTVPTGSSVYPYDKIKELAAQYPPSTGFYFYPASGLIVINEESRPMK